MDDLSRYFEILEIPRGASLEEIKRAYRDLAQVWHPDRYGHNPRLRSRAEDKLKRINEAYQQLSARFERSYTYAPSASQSSPQPPSNPSTAQNRGTAARETKPPAQPPPRPSPPPPTSRPHSASPVRHAPDAPTDSRPGARFLAYLTIAIIIWGIITLAAAPHGKSTPSLAPAPVPKPPFSPPPPATAAEYEQLARIKVQIQDRVSRKDADFDRLQQWYQHGVDAKDETGYRAALDKARRDELEIAALILTYNAAKKSLDARNPSK